ncbi:MAG: glutathione S-transferase family protein [Caulobacter sp.]|nr:glutathione S-transferase family protein [Caulobacter sp.]
MAFRLYGTPGSLYTGKVRSYLIKQGIPFDSRAAGEARFREEIVGKLGRWIIPVLETPEGELLQDGSAIIERLEADGHARWSTFPTTPRHRLIGQVFELFGGEGLLRPAMHYRWNFDATNQPFIANDFIAGLAVPGADPAEGQAIFQFAAQRMRKAMASFGVSPTSIPLVEAAYEQFLDLFDAHLAQSPYLLGGRPTIGDYGLIAPLYAHLGRDPFPASLMKARAHRVWRWVERMNAPDLDAGEYGCPPAELFPDDSVPDTLKDLLRFVAEDYLPEVRAYVGFANAWLAERPGLEPMTSGLPRTSTRAIGMAAFDWRGAPVEVAVMPYRLWLLQKVQDAAAVPADGEGTGPEALLRETGLSELVTLTTARRIERVGQLEVWAGPG